MNCMKSANEEELFFQLEEKYDKLQKFKIIITQFLHPQHLQADFAALPDFRLSMAQLFKRSTMGRHFGR